MSYKAQRRYIDPRTGRIKINKLLQDSDHLPARHRRFKSFKDSFDGTNHYEYDFKGFFIVIDVKYAFEHFTKNTYNDQRSSLNATLLPTLKDPLIVIKSSYEENSTLTFYKPFRNSNDIEHMLMFKAYKQENNKYYFKTIYKADGLGKIQEIIETTDANTVFFKYEDE